MKKILIILLIILLFFGAYTIVVKGMEIAGFKVHGYSDIKKMNEELENKITQASQLTSVDFPGRYSSLVTAGKQLAKAKERYQDKIAYSSEEEIKLATQIKEFKLEFLFTKLGNYRLKEGVNVDLAFEQKNVEENTWNIHFIVTGKYLPITEFIRDIEDDDDLNFRIESFTLTPGENTEKLKADFYVTNIGLTEVDASIINSTTNTNQQNNINTINNTNTNTINNTSNNELAS